MAKNGSKLRRALDRHQGKDYAQLHQKKLVKDARKRKDMKQSQRGHSGQIDNASNGNTNELGNPASEGGVTVNGDVEEWESASADGEMDEDTDEEAKAGFDMSRLEDSDSESDDDSEDGADASTRQVKAALASLKANGLPLPSTTITTTNTKAVKPASKSTPLKPSTSASIQPAQKSEDVNEVDDEDDASASDIPLSDIGSDTEDLIPHRRLTINNTAALTRALAAFALPLSSLPFSEHHSVTTSAPVSIPDADDDLNRELAFYAQCLSAVKEARKRLKAEGSPFTRPTDYFAEMVKSDEHMGKVKGKLVDDAAGKKAAAEARRQRDLKKFGKQVQQEKLKERAADKRQMLDRVNVLKRKRQGGELDTKGGEAEGMFDVELEDAVEGGQRDAKRKRDGTRSHSGGRDSTGAGTGAGARGGLRGRGGSSTRGGFGARSGRGGAGAGAGAGAGQSNPRRARKNEKFGFGGKKRFAKSGDAMSSGDVSGFSVKKMKGQEKGGASKRLGKARRAKQR